jgi:peroxiredoxin
MMAQEGDLAPDFRLEADDGSAVQLGELRGRKVVLFFYPRANTPGCTIEACEFRDRLPGFDTREAVVFGISTDSFFSHKAWADSLELKHRLLADMHRTVSKSYGLYFDTLNCAKRATVIVDKNGKVAYVKVQEIKTARDDKEILAELKKLS